MADSEFRVRKFICHLCWHRFSTEVSPSDPVVNCPRCLEELYHGGWESSGHQLIDVEEGESEHHKSHAPEFTRLSQYEKKLLLLRWGFAAFCIVWPLVSLWLTMPLPYGEFLGTALFLPGIIFVWSLTDSEDYKLLENHPLTPSIVLSTLMGVFFWIGSCILLWIEGFYGCTISQIVLFLCIFLQWDFPPFNLFRRETRAIVRFYETWLPKTGVIRRLFQFVPPLNVLTSLFLVIRLFPFFLFAVLLDATSEAVTRWIIPVPQWGAAAKLTYRDAVLWEALFTAGLLPSVAFTGYVMHQLAPCCRGREC